MLSVVEQAAPKATSIPPEAFRLARSGVASPGVRTGAETVAVVDATSNGGDIPVFAQASSMFRPSAARNASSPSFAFQRNCTYSHDVCW